MLRIRNLSNQFEKRKIRPLYAQTQATPYAATLDASLRDSSGSIRLPLAADATPLNRAIGTDTAAFTYKGGLPAGLCVAKAGAGEGIVIHNGAGAVRTFGLLANNIGGELDDLGDENQVGVWRGPDAVFEILAPVFDDTSISTAYASATAGNPVRLYAGRDGRLTATAPTLTNADGAHTAVEADVVALLVERVSASRIVVDLKV